MAKRNTKQDLQKIAQLFFKNLLYDDGYIGLSAKYPFGNEDYQEQILEQIDWKPEAPNESAQYYPYTDNQWDYATRLYEMLVPYLQREYISDYSAWKKEERERKNSFKETIKEDDNDIVYQEENEITPQVPKANIWTKIERWLESDVVI